MEKSQKTLSQFYCKFCYYNTSKNSDFNKHLVTRKHLIATNNENLASLGNVNVSKISPPYNCNYCNYNTNIKSSYDKHLLTEKHKTNYVLISEGEPKQTKHICCQCNKEYLNYNALWKHKKHCTIINNEKEEIELQNNTGNLRFPRTPLPFFPFQ